MDKLREIKGYIIPEKKPKESGFDKALKIVLFIGACAGIAALAYLAYRKFNEYMRNLCEANCEDYLDELACEDDAEADIDDAFEDDEDRPDREIEVEVADESDFASAEPAENDDAAAADAE